jgi:hypothetical protein
MRKRKRYREIKGNITCPCGSGRIYKKCCKKKAYKWEIGENGDIVKTMSMPPEACLELKKMKTMFIEMFGREPGGERIFCNIPDDKIDYDHNLIRIMRNTCLDEDIIYAYYKTGLIITNDNKKFISDIDYTLWKAAIKEYNQLINQKLSSSMDIIQAVAFANSMLREICLKYFEQFDFVLGMFISLTQDQKQDYNSFNISSVLDFLAYCAHRTQKNIVTIKTLVKEGMAENALATVRFIFESYLNAAVYTKDTALFNEKVLPLAGLDNGTHSRVLRNDGTVDRYSVKDNQTNKIFNTKILIKDLAIKSSKNDETFYTILYGDLSQYIHIDVLAAKKYFSTSDPFYEIDEALIAGYLSIFFSTQLISTFCKFDDIPVTLRKDLIFFATKVKKDIAIILELLICIDELPFYKIIKTCLLEEI